MNCFYISSTHSQVHPNLHTSYQAVTKQKNQKYPAARILSSMNKTKHPFFVVSCDKNTWVTMSSHSPFFGIIFHGNAFPFRIQYYQTFHRRYCRVYFSHILLIYYYLITIFKKQLLILIRLCDFRARPQTNRALLRFCNLSYKCPLRTSLFAPINHYYIDKANNYSSVLGISQNGR